MKFWLVMHTWTSLVSTLLLLVIFVSGLPLIFRGEINHVLGYAEGQGPTAVYPEALSADDIVQAGLKRFPNKFVHYVVWEKDKPNIVTLSMGKAPDSSFFDNHNVLVDAYTGQIVEDRPEPLAFFVDLHAHLLAGSMGAMILGCLALLFLLATISGVVIYGPFMKKLDFGTVRKKQSCRLKWLDYHNLLGMVLLGWILVVGATGMINSWGEYLFLYWRSDQLAQMIAPYQDLPMKEERAALDISIQAAQKALPHMEPYFLAYPQSFVSSDHHYAVFMRGRTAKTENVMQPVLIDAVTGDVSATRELPAYMRFLYLSQPLHFGDYGGLPLKIIWVVFDVGSIILLSSGLYLWIARRRKPFRSRLENIGTRDEFHEY